MAGTVAVSHRRLPPPAQEGCGRPDRRRTTSAIVQSSGDRLETAPLAGASGDQETGAGEEEKTGELQMELEGSESGSDRRRSSRRRRESGGGREVPAVASGECSRPRQGRSRPAVLVRSLRWMLAACGGRNAFRTKLRSFPDDQARLLWLERRNAIYGLTVSCRRPGERSVAPRLGWSAPGDCWSAGREV